MKIFASGCGRRAEARASACGPERLRWPRRDEHDLLTPIDQLVDQQRIKQPDTIRSAVRFDRARAVGREP